MPGEHRVEIGQATGMLTVQSGLTAAEAHARLRAYAYARDRRLAAVAPGQARGDFGAFPPATRR